MRAVLLLARMLPDVLMMSVTPVGLLIWSSSTTFAVPEAGRFWMSMNDGCVLRWRSNWRGLWGDEEGDGVGAGPWVGIRTIGWTSDGAMTSIFWIWSCALEWSMIVTPERLSEKSNSGQSEVCCWLRFLTKSSA